MGSSLLEPRFEHSGSLQVFAGHVFIRIHSTVTGFLTCCFAQLFLVRFLLERCTLESYSLEYAVMETIAMENCALES